MNQRTATLPGRAFLIASAIAMVLLLILSAHALRAQQAGNKDASKDKDFSVTVHGPQTDAGLMVSARATAKEVGLPLYPGSTPHKDEDSDSSSAKLGLWGNSSGFKLVVLKMESKDSPKKVADFYQKALAQYGTVLDCTNAIGGDNKDDKSDKLTCGDDKPEKGGMIFKSGSKSRQHIVGVEPAKTVTIFKLVYIEVRGEHNDPA